MQEVWVAMGRESQPKAAFKRARDAHGTSTAEPPEPGLLEQLEALIQGRVIVEGKSTDLKTLTAVYGFLKSTLTGGAKAEATEDMRRLSVAERDCLCALTAKLNGHELEPLDEWYVALLARVPPSPEETHPAHVPLPPGQPPTLTVVVP
jgi:hypothetical protein